jgi:hypothetical protein
LKRDSEVIISRVIKPLLRKFLTGYTLTQEYLCLPFQKTSNPFKIILALEENEWDVTDTHVFLGYKPVVFGIPVTDPNRIKMLHQRQDCSLYYRHVQNIDNEKNVAVFALRKFATETFSDTTIFFYEAGQVSHSLQNWWHRQINRLIEKLTSRNANNIQLSDNLYDQVRVAYAVPRVISIITMRDGSKMNMFPTDLHGKISGTIYVSSLRMGGKATEQVEALRNICISDVAAETFADTYRLGRNHMAELRPETEFTVARIRSKNFQTPLPTGIISYRELELLHSFNRGIHRIHFYRIVSEEALDPNIPRLAHIHKLYAQWRINLNIPTTLLFR